METKKIIAAAFFIIAVAAAHAQPVVKKRTGNLRGQGNIAAGYLLNQKTSAAYLAGDWDLFIDENVSVTGEGWYGFKLRNSTTGLLNNHAVFGGLNYHLLKKGRFDPYIGFSPGVAIVKMGYLNEESSLQTDYTAAPLISGVIGCNYYVGSIFHFFVKMRGVAGRARGAAPEPSSLNEIKLTAGLGWNLRLWKAK